MTTIRAKCPDCGNLELRPADFVLIAFDYRRKGGVYAFQCPCCELRVSKDCSQRIFDLLVDYGVRLQYLRKPAELDEPRYGPPIEHDELLDFHEGLQDETHWFDDLVLQVRRRLGR